MTKEVLEQLLHESESPYLDFKRQQYAFVGATDQEKSELLKDILAFSNAWRRTDAYILIGVEEVKGERGVVHGISDHFDDAAIQQFVNSKTQRPINFAVETVTIDRKKIDVVRIPSQSRPFYLKNNYGKLKAGVVYLRRGTTTIEANPDDIAAMGTDTAPAKNPEPILQVEFARSTFEWIGPGKSETLGPELRIKKKAFDASLLDQRYRGSFVPQKPQAQLENAERLLRDMERGTRLFGMMEHLNFAVTNRGSVSALSIETHIEIPKNLGLFVATQAQVSPFRNQTISQLLEDSSKAIEKGLHFQEAKDSWNITQRIERILAEHTIFSPESYCFGAVRSGRWEIKARVYADNLPAPVHSSVFLEIVVED